MTVRRKIAGLCAAATLSLAVAAPAHAAPAGDEYLPKLPQSGAHSSSGGSSNSASAGTGTTTLPTGGTSSPSTSGGDKSQSGGTDKKDKKDKADQKIAPVSSGSGGSDDGDSSGSILFNPIVLLMIAAVIAVAVGMTLRRRSSDEGDQESPAPTGRAARRGGSPKTPDGEIATGPDRIA
jgi:hypothetical protein